MRRNGMMDSLIEQFVLETRDHLEEASRGLLSLEQSPDDVPVFNAVFRNFRAIQGTSGIFETFAPISSMTHSAENLMDSVRKNEIPLTPGMTDLLLGALDLLGDWMDRIQKAGELPVDAEKRSDEIRSRLAAVGAEAGKSPEQAPPRESPGDALGEGNGVRRFLEKFSETDRRDIHGKAHEFDALAGIYFHPDKDSFFLGVDPLALLKQVSLPLKLIVADREPWSGLESFDPFLCNLDFYMIARDSRESLDAIFGFVEDRVTVHLFSPDSLVFPVGDPSSIPAKIVPGKRLIQAYDDSNVDAIMEVMEGVMAEADPDTTIASVCRWIAALLEMDRLASPILGKLIREIASPPGEEAGAPIPGMSDGERGGEVSSSLKSPAGKTFRVDPSIVDRLNNLVGELVIVKNGLAHPRDQALHDYGAPDLAEEIDRGRDAIDGVVKKLQDDVARMGMPPFNVS